MSGVLTIEDIERARAYLNDAPIPSPSYIPAYGLDDEAIYRLMMAGVRLLVHPNQMKRVKDKLET